MRKTFQFILVPALLIIAGCGNHTETTSKTAQSEVIATLAEDSGTKTYGTIQLTKEDFLVKVMNYEKNTNEWVFEGDKPCLIDFYADWCAPCRITSPILEELAQEYGDQIHIYKVDTQKERELAMVFGIQSIPAFLYCPMQGKPVMSAGIAQSPEETKKMFRQQIDQILLGKEV